LGLNLPILVGLMMLFDLTDNYDVECLSFLPFFVGDTGLETLMSLFVRNTLGLTGDIANDSIFSIFTIFLSIILLGDKCLDSFII
jgi:hypothetical protein